MVSHHPHVRKWPPSQLVEGPFQTTMLFFKQDPAVTANSTHLGTAGGRALPSSAAAQTASPEACS